MDIQKENFSSVYDIDVFSLNELLYKLFNENKDIIKLLENKTDLYGDHKGSWQGLDKPTLSEEGLRSIVEKLQTIGYIINDFNDLKNAIENNNYNILITKNIDIIENLEIPKDFTLYFLNDGLFKINPNVTLILNSDIIAPFKQIFKIDNNGNIISNKNDKSNNINYNVKIDWFGAYPNCYIPEDNEYLDIGVCYGEDSTNAFKQCLTFIESGCNTFNTLNPRRNQSCVTLEFKPNGNYYCIGDNPLGVQSTLKNIGYFINIEGNKACINWKPLTKTDSLFNKYGRVVSPSIQNLNVNLIGNKGQRWGKFLNSKTDEGDQYHYWTHGIFKNLFLNVQYSQVGYDIVFNLENDIIASHDDTSLMENIYGGCYNTFLNIANGEAVNWKLDKCDFNSHSENAIHINVLPSYSGGLNIVNSDILLAENNEIFLKVRGNISINPFNIIGSRIENRNTSNIQLLNMDSGRVNIEGLNILGGNDGIPKDELKLCYIGEKAQANFKDCELFDKFIVELNKSSDYIYNQALTFDNCSFMGKITDDEIITLGYPTIIYSCDNVESDIEYAIKQGFKLRSINIINPRYVNSWLNTDIEYGNSYYSKEQKIRINNVDSKGYTKLNVSGSLPPYLAITNLDISYSGTNLENVTSVYLKFINRKYSQEITIEHVLTTEPQYNKILVGGILTLPFNNFNEIVVYFQNNGVTINDTDLMPNGYIEMTIKGINCKSELPSSPGTIQNKDKLTFN